MQIEKQLRITNLKTGKVSYVPDTERNKEIYSRMNKHRPADQRLVIEPYDPENPLPPVLNERQKNIVAQKELSAANAEIERLRKQLEEKNSPVATTAEPQKVLETPVKKGDPGADAGADTGAGAGAGSGADSGDDVKLSTGMNAATAINYIKNVLETAEAIEAFITGDDRVSVTSVAAARINELKSN